MKKIIMMVVIGAWSLSCAKKQEIPAESNVMLTEPEKTSAVADAGSNGKSLIMASDCMTCHKDDAKLIGPSYQEVAAKYENTPANIDLLAEKIIKGGQGVWGEVPMAPHPNITKEDAQKMSQYIMTLKK